MMSIVITLDVMLARRKMKSKDLAAAIGITEANLSKLKRGSVKGIRLETLNKICTVLDCAPGDLLAYEPDAMSAPVDESGGVTNDHTRNEAPH